MRIIEIEALENGAHRNQQINGTIKVPIDFAVIPDEMEIPDTFPFVNIEVDNGIVTAMTEGVVPEIEIQEQAVSEVEQLRADIDYIALMKGVDL